MAEGGGGSEEARKRVSGRGADGADVERTWGEGTNNNERRACYSLSIRHAP